MKKKKVLIIITIAITIVILFVALAFYFIFKITKKRTDNHELYDSWVDKPDHSKIKLLPPVYFINLKHRTDRLRHIRKQFKKINYPKDKIIRVDAVKNVKNGHKGCLASHIKALKMVLISKHPYVMILEDDIKFLNNGRVTIHSIVDTIQQPNWNVLLLDCAGIRDGGRITEYKKSRSTSNNHGCGTTTGYIIKREYIPTLLGVWEPLVDINNWIDSIHCIDQVWKKLQDETWINIIPKIATQLDNYSNTGGIMTNFHKKRNSWKKGPDGIPVELTMCQTKMTGMLKVFDKLCKENNIKYWAMSGTLLGIVRHKGWIPHDGDIDLGILTEDLAKFKKISWKLPIDLWFQDKDDKKWKNDHKYMAKIRDLSSCYIEYTKKKKDNRLSHNGLQIDLFIHYPNGNGKLDNIVIKQLNQKDIFPLKKGTFEGMEVPIPNDSRKLLIEEYGKDYMKLPPKNKRYPHEGACWVYKTCPHHKKIYPNLYISENNQISSQKTPRVCWCFWFGSRKLPQKRMELLNKIKQVLGVEVKLITCDNISKYLIKPIHVSVPYLSGVHKSDYFRCYFLLHYGGGYMDIKNPSENWVKYFELLDMNPSIQIVGASQCKGCIIGDTKNPYHEQIIDWEKWCIPTCHIIARGGSNFMKDMHTEQNLVLDKHYFALAKRSSLGLGPPKRKPGSWDNYPLQLAELNDYILPKVCIKHYRDISAIMKIHDSKTYYGKNDISPPKNKPVGERTMSQKWIEEDYLKPYTLPPPKPKKMLAVSGYWDIGKFTRNNYGHDKYMKKIKNTTSFNTDYLINGEENITSLIQQLRGNKKTYTNILTWKELVNKCEKEFDKNNILQAINDTSLHNNKHCPSAEILLIWLSKVLLVKEAMKMYPEYSHYGWIDAGYKGGNIDSSKVWPTPFLDKVKGFYVKRIKRACKQEYWRDNLNKCPIGGMWFGDKNSIIEFCDICITIIKEQLDSKNTVCADQDIFELALREMESKIHDLGIDEKYNAFYI
jgi:phosphorylcholine metabolism protein LicD